MLAGAYNKLPSQFQLEAATRKRLGRSVKQVLRCRCQQQCWHTPSLQLGTGSQLISCREHTLTCNTKRNWMSPQRRRVSSA